MNSMSGALKSLLRDHARTFSLTLNILPPFLREPLGVAYLLARTSDTLADAGNLARKRRISMLEELAGSLDRGDFLSWNPKVQRGELSESEEELITAIPLLLGALKELRDREEVLRLWRTILEGQLFDLHRFSVEGDSQRPLTREELQRYCYLVAGSVGESWTRLLARHASNIMMKSPEEMIPLGAAYGKGLQLVNILRDRSADRAIGRIYVRNEDRAELFELAESWLEEGRKYLRQLRSGRVRYASGLPLELAFGTLEKIRSCPGVDRVKLPRIKVYAILFGNLPSLWLPRLSNPAS